MFCSSWASFQGRPRHYWQLQGVCFTGRRDAAECPHWARARKSPEYKSLWWDPCHTSPSMTRRPQSIQITERQILIPDHGTEKAQKSPFLIQGHAWASVVCNCVMLDSWVTSVFTRGQPCVLWVLLGKHSKHWPGLSIEDICHHIIPKGKERLFHMCTQNPSGLFYSNTEI